MIKEIALALILAFCSVEQTNSQDFRGPDTVSLQSGQLTLRGLLWRPTAAGSFPTVIFSHGSYTVNDSIITPEQQISSLGPVFARKGYIYLALFRRALAFQKAKEKMAQALWIMH